MTPTAHRRRRHNNQGQGNGAGKAHISRFVIDPEEIMHSEQSAAPGPSHHSAFADDPFNVVQLPNAHLMQLPLSHPPDAFPQANYIPNIPPAVIPVAVSRLAYQHNPLSMHLPAPPSNNPIVRLPHPNSDQGLESPTQQRVRVERQGRIAELRARRLRNEAQRQNQQFAQEQRRVEQLEQANHISQAAQLRRDEDVARDLAAAHLTQLRRNQQIARQNAAQHMPLAINEQHAIPLQPPVPRGRQPYSEQNPVQRHSLGKMDVECNHCHALHFDSERLAASSRRNPRFGSCCLQGQIQLLPLPEPPRVLKELLSGSHLLSADFKKNI